jgi:hypothetical protein
MKVVRCPDMAERMEAERPETHLDRSIPPFRTTSRPEVERVNEAVLLLEME